MRRTSMNVSAVMVQIRLAKRINRMESMVSGPLFYPCTAVEAFLYSELYQGLYVREDRYGLAVLIPEQ